MNSTALHKQILKRHHELEKRIPFLEKQINSYLEGKLICSKNKTRWKWYESNGKTKTYIPKKCKDKAEKLAAKKYLSTILKDLVCEKKAIDFYLNHYREPQAPKLLTHNEEYEKLLAPFFSPVKEDLSNWATAPYERNPHYPEQLIHRTNSRQYVRSKSEALIHFFLYQNKIPFRYEAALHLDDLVLFPDFTIRHPETGQFFYWEHFGLIDKPSYVQNTLAKLDTYISHNIFPSINLITTFETKEHPLSIEMIEKIIQFYFL